MTTSCCAGYNQFVKKHLPELSEFKSTTETPLYYIAEIVKKKYPDAITVFISPCVAKRKESMDNPNVDYVMTYEELGALFIAKQLRNVKKKNLKPKVQNRDVISGLQQVLRKRLSLLLKILKRLNHI